MADKGFGIIFDFKIDGSAVMRAVKDADKQIFGPGAGTSYLKNNFTTIENLMRSGWLALYESLNVPSKKQTTIERYERYINKSEDVPTYKGRTDPIDAARYTEPGLRTAALENAFLLTPDAVSATAAILRTGGPPDFITTGVNFDGFHSSYPHHFFSRSNFLGANYREKLTKEFLSGESGIPFADKVMEVISINVGNILSNVGLV